MARSPDFPIPVLLYPSRIGPTVMNGLCFPYDAQQPTSFPNELQLQYNIEEKRNLN